MCEREYSDESKKHPLWHHRDGRCLAETVAWSIRDKGPVESQFHEVRNPTAHAPRVSVGGEIMRRNEMLRC